MLPAGFCYLSNLAPSIQFDIKYATADNLLGRPVQGYEQNVCIVTEELGHTLSTIQDELRPQGLALFVFETYRPQCAGEDLLAWAMDDQQQGDQAAYYPNIAKNELYRLGYLIENSAHSRGSTVDLTLIDSTSGQALDMGTRFDFMDELSHPSNNNVSAVAFANRHRLRELMFKHRFVGIDTEWWHFTLQDEPFPDESFIFPVR